MTANVLSRIFTIEIGDTPTLTFEAQNLREAHELCHEQWLKDDLAEAKSDGAPLWDGKAKLRARIALPDALFAEANNNGQPSDGLMLVYLVELDGEEPPVDPGAFPPARTYVRREHFSTRLFRIALRVLWNRICWRYRILLGRAEIGASGCRSVRRCSGLLGPAAASYSRSRRTCRCPDAC
jgi:hypothetical protein